MLRIVKRWPVAAVLASLHAVALLVITILFYTSHDPERVFIWIYGLLASYPSSLLVRFLTNGNEAILAVFLFLIGTLQWGIIGISIDAIVHRAKREATAEHLTNR
jgi:hypothetical protein